MRSLDPWHLIRESELEIQNETVESA